MWIIRNEVQTHPGWLVYGRLILEAEADSNSCWTGPPVCVGRPCWSSSPQPRSGIIVLVTRVLPPSPPYKTCLSSLVISSRGLYVMPINLANTPGSHSVALLLSLPLSLSYFTVMYGHPLFWALRGLNIVLWCLMIFSFLLDFSIMPQILGSSPSCWVHRFCSYAV